MKSEPSLLCRLLASHSHTDGWKCPQDDPSPATAPLALLKGLCFPTFFMSTGRYGPGSLGRGLAGRAAYGLEDKAQRPDVSGPGPWSDSGIHSLMEPSPGPSAHPRDHLTEPCGPVS